ELFAFVAQEKQPAWVFDRRTVTTESISVLVSAHGSPKTFAVGSWFHGAWPVVWSTAGIPERLRLRLEGPGQPGAGPGYGGRQRRKPHSQLGAERLRTL